MLLWMILGIIAVALIAIDIKFRRMSNQLYRVIDDQSLPSVIPTGGDPLFSFIKIFYLALTSKECDFTRIKDIITKNGDHRIKMSQSVMFGQQFLMIWDPELYKQVLSQGKDNFEKPVNVVESFNELLYHSVFSRDGDNWRRQRSVMAPSFHFDQLKRLVPKFVSVALRLCEKWSEFDDGSAVEILQWTNRLTLDALGEASFGYNFDAINGKTTDVYRAYNLILAEFTNPLRTIDRYEKMNTERNQKYNTARAELRAFLMSVINRKKSLSSEQRGHDLLDLLVEANETGGSEVLSDEELLQNTFLFFLAGHETSSATLSFMIFEIAKNTEIQRRIQEEVEQVLGGRHPTYEDLKNLHFVENTIKETLRMHPPGAMFSRRTKDSVVMNGYHIPKGVTVVGVSFHTQLSAEYWNNPTTFNPDRFDHEKPKHQYAYMPFGLGPRSCIGQNFAMLEMKAALALFVQRFKFSLAPGFEEMKYPKAVTLQPTSDFKVIINKR